MVVPVGIKASLPFRNVIISGLGGGYIASGLIGDLLFLEDINDNHGDWLKIEWGDQDEELNRLDYGLNFGISIKYKNAQFGAYYELGLADIVVHDPPTRKNLNRSLQLCVTYNLWRNLKQR